MIGLLAAALLGGGGEGVLHRIQVDGPAARPFRSLRLAIRDLMDTFGTRYPRGPQFLARLDDLERRPAGPETAREFRNLQRESLLANPLLDGLRLLAVKRRVRGAGLPGLTLGFPSNHECNSSLPRGGWDNEIALLSSVFPDGRWTTLYRAPADVDCFDPCYLPDGGIVFASTACVQAVPCWHGQKRVANLYRMDADGSGMRRLCFDQDHDFHPCVLPTGQVLYHRWDYTGINHIFLRLLMVMNPDGTGQKAVYGSNSWYPNGLYFPRPLPGRPGGVVSILSGYHGVHRMGQLVLVDLERGWHGADGLVLRISGRGDPIRPVIRDQLVDQDWPKFLHPFPLSDRHFLVSCCPDPKSGWGLYYADVFDNVVLLREEPGFALLEPVPVLPRPRPPVLPDRGNSPRGDAAVYLHDVHAGPGLAGVPRGTVKALRLVAYHFGYPGLAGPDLVGYGGPWEVMRILGTVPLEEDGSAFFRVPARTPMSIQALDAEGKAVQLMRSWFVAMPGEIVSCSGCHEGPAETPGGRPAAAARRGPRDPVPWYGPARGFSFAREVQPVLNRHCIGCHDGRPEAGPDLRPREAVAAYRGSRISDLAIHRLHPEMKGTGGVIRFTPAYEALLPHVRRVGIEDDVSLLLPGEYHADTSPLIQMLRKGHQGVRLDAEAWDRLVTWIDLNAPCHGTWGEVHPIPEGAHERRMALRRAYGGPEGDPEVVPPSPPYAGSPTEPAPPPLRDPGIRASERTAPEESSRAGNGPVREWVIDLGGGVSLKLVRIPAGEFVLGDPEGEPDERPARRLKMGAFWMGAFEVTNAQFRRFDPRHDPHYYARRHAASDDPGLPLDGPDQPAVRVSWERALDFCRWLSARTGRRFTLPTEAQWEYACRAGSNGPLFWGDPGADFSPWANVADRSFGPRRQVTGGVEHLVLEGAALADVRFDDGAVVTCPVGRYRPNPWGLFDMHGNAAEWTRTEYRPYPYDGQDGREEEGAGGRRVVRGGSFADPPRRCRSAFRLAYPPWQRLGTVGFRVACAEGS